MMRTIDASPAILLLGMAIPLLCGLALLTWGRRIARYASWLAAAALVPLLAAAGYDWSLIAGDGFRAQAWLRGWVWPRVDAGAITVGILRDPLGLAMSIAAALVSGALLLNSRELAREPRPERFYSALALAAAGVSLSWVSATPWFAFAGTILAVFAGFIALGSRWDRESESRVAIRFAWERSCGILLSILGACILAGPRAALLLGQAESWSAQAGASGYDAVGAALLVAGAFLQLQPFPLLGWVMAASEVPCSMRIALTQVFPAWSVFALLIRLEPQLRSLGILPGFGWVGLVSTTLTVAAGLFQPEWRLGAGAWVSAGYSLVLAALAFAGPWPAAALLVGVSLGGCALASAGSALEAGGGSSQSNRKRALWSKAGVFLGAAAGTGLIGFASAAGGIRWIGGAWGEPALAASFAVAIFLFALLGWKVAWIGARVKNHTQAHWAAVLSPLALVVLSLGILWTGTASGGAIPGSPDRAMSSLLTLFFGPSSETALDETAFLSASGLYWGALAAALSLAYWLSGRKQDLWQNLGRAMPRFSAFLIGGYGVDRAMGKGLSVLGWVGASSQLLVDTKIWGDWLPAGLFAGVRRGAGAIAAVDGRVRPKIGIALSKSVDVPSKLLQLIQNGDLQWYLFFAVGSGLALLLHFLRT